MGAKKQNHSQPQTGSQRLCLDLYVLTESIAAENGSHEQPKKSEKMTAGEILQSNRQCWY